MTPPPLPGSLPTAALVAVSIMLTLELVRSSGPLLDLALGHGGVPAAAAMALLTYLAPGPITFLMLHVKGRHSSGLSPGLLLGGAGLLAAMRLLAQGTQGGARFAVGLVTVAVGIAVLTLAVAVLAGRPGGGRTSASAVCAGAAAAVGVQLALSTWDAYWRHTVLGWSVTVAVAAALAGLAMLAARSPVDIPPRAAPGRLWALGPLLALTAMMLANPAFAASQSGLSLTLAGPLNGFGWLVASWVLISSARRRRTPAARGLSWRPLSFVALLIVGVAAALGVGGSASSDGVAVLVALFAAQLSAGWLLARALEPQPAAPGSAGTVKPGRIAGTASLVGLGTILPLLVYQIDYDVPLGFPNELILIAAAASLGLAGLGARAERPDTHDSHRPTSWAVPAAACALVVVGTAAVNGAWLQNRRATSTLTAPQPGAEGVRALSWNLHYGVSPTGSVDLETIAQTIEVQQPDVVLLQEVSRGWILGGGADMATWLSHRLGRNFVFAPAADRRFGNAILSSTELQAVAIHRLPYGNGPQHRSAISAQIRVGHDTVTVASVHLQQRDANAPTRIRQIESLLPGIESRDDPALPLIMGGDLNAEPGSKEVALLTTAGFVSAIDDVGDSTALTSPSIRPRRRIDWVLGRGVRFRQAAVLVDARSSDHLPLVAATAPR